MLRRKVASRLQARRRAASGQSGDEENTEVSYSSLESATRNETSGFLLVDDDDKQDRGVDDQVQASDELEGLELELEGEDEPQPKPGRERSGTSGDRDGGVSVEEPAKKKPWQSASKDVYEQQLQLMQEQLEYAMIENQKLQSELKDLKQCQRDNAHRELSGLVRENRELSRKLETAEASPKAGVGRVTETTGSYGGASLSVNTSPEGYEQVSVRRDRVARAHERRNARRAGFFQGVREKVYDVLADFTDEANIPSDQPEEDPSLTAKKLKENLQRLSHSSKPWREFGDFLQSVLNWRSVAETLVVFLIYMYCVWNGWVIPMVLFVAVLWLSINYLKESGLAEQFGFQARKPPPEIEELRFTDKLQLVKNVARTCQNRSGDLSDVLEKAQNLFLWHQPEATRRLYSTLCSFLVISLFLPNTWLLTAVGLGAGFKLFIINNVYRKYPKVKEKYDSVAKMWKSLPTNADLLARQQRFRGQMPSHQRYDSRSTSVDTIASSSSEEGNPLSGGPSEDEISFCTRFQLSLDELPLSSWQSGRRCSLMDRDKPLSLTKSGKLFLTHSFLCFERVGRDSGRLVITLKDVTAVVKAKPFSILPGSGMSIEVTLRSGVKHLFSAILNRDQAYHSILDQGMILGLPWGSDPIDLASADADSASVDKKSEASDETDN